MNKVRNFCIGFGIVVLCVALYMVLTVVTKKPQSAIDFTATAADGVSFSLSDNYGKCGTVLIFIDPEVEGSLTVLDEIIANKGDAEIIAISVSELSESEQLKKLNENALSLKKLCFDGADVKETYNISNAPITYFIDKEGLVQNAFVGNIKEETIKNYVDRVTE